MCREAGSNTSWKDCLHSPKMHLGCLGGVASASLGSAVSLGARHRLGSPYSKRNLLCSGTYCAGCLLGNALGSHTGGRKEAGLIGQREKLGCKVDPTTGSANPMVGRSELK